MAQKANAIVVVNDISSADKVAAAIKQRGFDVQIYDNTEAALEECRKTAPQLAIVEERVGPMQGVNFIGALIAISWTVNSVLITDKDHETVHEITEGLGVLGAITGTEDIEGLNKLLDTFDAVIAGQPSA